MGLGSIRRLLILAIASAGLLSAGSEHAQSNQLDVVPSADLPNIDPVFASVVITRIFGMMVYEELFAWGNDLQPQPEMVQSWSNSPDELTWQFTLRDSLKFHDGSPVTSADVIASLKRWMQKDVVGQKIGLAVADLDAINDKTFELKLKHPVPYLTFALGSAIGQVPFIMPAKLLGGLDPSKPRYLYTGQAAVVACKWRAWGHAIGYSRERRTGRACHHVGDYVRVMTDCGRSVDA